MKVLVALLLYNYGKKELGLSYEYNNVVLPLQDELGKERVITYDYYTDFINKGKTKMNEYLGELIRSEKPDTTIFCLYKDQFDEEYLAEYRKHTKTVAYFIDDEWRRNFVRRYIPHFDHFTTRDYYMFRGYLSEGLDKVIFCPLGFNKNIYVKKDLIFKYDISFVGGYSPERSWILSHLEKEGFRINVFGWGWGSKDKIVTQEEMVDIFNQSRINLNLTNSRIADYRFILHSLKSPRALRTIRKSQKDREGIKGRHFEICGCGGFQLSFYVRGLNLFYEIDKEIVVYENIDSITDYIRFYLKNEEMRTKIAQSGYERSLKDHSAQKYLMHMVKQAMD